MSRYLSLAAVTLVLALLFLPACSGSVEVEGDPEDCQAMTCEDAGRLDGVGDDPDMDSVAVPDVESLIPDADSTGDMSDTGTVVVVDSLQGDFEALQALYSSTQGEELSQVSSESELPTPEEASYPYMHMIDGEIWWVKFDKEGDAVEWRNAGGPWKDRTGWEDMTPETMGDAVGIEVDENGRVVEIDMQKVTTRPGSSEGILTDGNTLAGELPAELGNLKRLKKFNVKQNFLYGEIPPQLGLMENLERLSLAGHHWEIDVNDKRLWVEAEHVHYNKNDGTDPYSYSVSGKDFLATNRFRSDLPPEIGQLGHLELIELGWQYITGELPEEWGELSSLRGLFMEELQGDFPDSLYSTIPESWGKMTAMVYFKMGNYQSPARLHGSLPTGMLDWSDLVNLSVHSNDLSGEFPKFSNLTELFYFNVSRNEFSGEFPWESIFNGNNSGLNKFAIANNEFSGTLPESIPDAVHPIDRPGGKYRIAAFGISYNQFEGDVPEWTTTMGGQRTYNISNNKFSGGFPPGLENNPSLKTLRIHDNNLSGELPDVVWRTDEMNWFQIRGNNFEGEIPESWSTLFQDRDGNWRSGQAFQFQGNNLSGRLPDWGKHVDINEYVFNGNRYTFRDIGPVYDELKAANIGFSVSNQKPFGNAQNRSGAEGETVTFDLSEYDYPGNSYQWLKDGTPVGGATSSVLTIPNASSADEGDYVLEVENSDLAALGTHQSEPITFQIK